MQASKKFYNICSENSRSQIVYQTDIFRKLTLGAPESPFCIYIYIYSLYTSNNHWLWIRVRHILRAWHLLENQTKGNKSESKGVQFPAAEMPRMKLILPLCHTNTRLGRVLTNATSLCRRYSNHKVCYISGAGSNLLLHTLRCMYRE